MDSQMGEDEEGACRELKSSLADKDESSETGPKILGALLPRAPACRLKHLNLIVLQIQRGCIIFSIKQMVLESWECGRMLVHLPSASKTLD